MTDFPEIERDKIAVQFIRVPDGIEHIRRAWDELEAVVALRGRHFYGAFDPVVRDRRDRARQRRGGGGRRRAGRSRGAGDSGRGGSGAGGSDAPRGARGLERG